MIDALGHPITKGCVVLTPGYWSPTAGTITKVVKVTKSYVFVEVGAWTWSEEKNGGVMEPLVVRRKAHQVIVVDKQLKYNRKTYPELLI